MRPWRPTPPFWIITGAILLVVLLLVASTVVAETVLYTPQTAVRQYFNALKNRDTTKIADLEDDLDQQSYAIKAIQGKDYQAPEDLRVGKVGRLGDDSRTVQITYKIGNRQFSSTIPLVRNQKRNAAGFFDWRPTKVLGGLQFQGAFFAAPKINGQPVPRNTDAIPALLPGGYRVTNAVNPLADVPAATVAVPAGGVGTAQLTATLKTGAVDKINRLVTKYVDRCISSVAGGTPDNDCTFLRDAGIYGGETIKLGLYPKINLNLTSEGITVSTTTKGSITLTSDWSGQDQKVPFSVDGYAYVDSNNNPVFSPRS